MEILITLYSSMAVLFISLFYFFLPNSFLWLRKIVIGKWLMRGLALTAISGLIYTVHLMRSLPDASLFQGKFQLIESYGFIPERMNDYHEFNIDSTNRFSFTMLPEIRACDSGTYTLVKGEDENYLVMNCGFKKDSAVIQRSLFRLQLGFFRKDRVHPSVWYERKLFEKQSRTVTF